MPMKDDALNDAVLRDFLLDKLAETQREQLEDSFLVDEATKERVLLAEEDLIEDYLEGSLDSEDNERFLERFGQTVELRRNLQIAASVKRYSVHQSLTPEVGPSGLLAIKRTFIIPALVAILLAVVAAVVWVNYRNKQPRGFELELAKLNSAASRTIPASYQFNLLPGNVRGAHENELKFHDTGGVLEVRLTWIEQERYATYQAKIVRVGESRSYMVANLTPVKDGNGYYIPLRLPSGMIRSGTYQVELSGVKADGSLSLSVEYVFSVGS